VNSTAGRPAGGFAAWLVEMRAALRGARDADVPCAGCTACCRAGQFITVDADETDALAHIPAELLFPAPGQPAGQLLLPHDERGHCPMLFDDRCSIYEHRPRACRMYDCRVYAAAGVAPDHQPEVAARVAQWRFDITTDADRAAAAEVRAASEALADDPNPTRRAVRAVTSPPSPPG
jgi:Fe-S-cluster containining protein